MKKSEYEQVQLEITYLEDLDTITTSRLGDEDIDDDGWTTPKKWT